VSYLGKSSEEVKSLARGFEAPSKPGARTGERIETEAITGSNVVAVDHDNQDPQNYIIQAKEILNFLNEKSEVLHPETSYNLNLIVDRLKAGATSAEFHHVIARKIRDWKGKEMAKYLTPYTLFREEKFNQYRSELVIPLKDGVADETTMS
jgi:uncharacterized phage protein (TIGR02220 family)